MTLMMPAFIRLNMIWWLDYLKTQTWHSLSSHRPLLYVIFFPVIMCVLGLKTVHQLSSNIINVTSTFFIWIFLAESAGRRASVCASWERCSLVWEECWCSELCRGDGEAALYSYVSHCRERPAQVGPAGKCGDGELHSFLSTVLGHVIAQQKTFLFFYQTDDRESGGVENSPGEESWTEGAD